MKSYCVACKNKTEYKEKPIINKTKTKNGKDRYLLVGKCIKGHKMMQYMGNNDVQQGSGLLSSLGLKTPLSKIPILGDILF